MMQRVFTLYGTSACHLCEEAAQMLAHCQGEDVDWRWVEEDIADSDALFERYGVRIPVLRAPDGRELGWPFSAADLQAFLRP